MNIFTDDISNQYMLHKCIYLLFVELIVRFWPSDIQCTSVLNCTTEQDISYSSELPAMWYFSEVVFCTSKPVMWYFSEVVFCTYKPVMWYFSEVVFCTYKLVMWYFSEVLLYTCFHAWGVILQWGCILYFQACGVIFHCIILPCLLCDT